MSISEILAREIAKLQKELQSWGANNQGRTRTQTRSRNRYAGGFGFAPDEEPPMYTEEQKMRAIGAKPPRPTYRWQPRYKPGID